MKFLIFIALVAFTTAHPQRHYQFARFMVKYNKVYNTAEEFQHRLDTYHANLKYIAKHNAGNHSYTLGENEFADMTSEEFVKVMNGYRQDPDKKSFNVFTPKVSSAPDTVNWVDKGFVTDIKNQGRCGSCWSFSATGSLEGQHYKATKQLVSLSEQNLMDCSRQYGNNGCEGGLMDNAFRYVINNRGIDTEASYPYRAVDESGCYFRQDYIGSDAVGYRDISSGDENALKSAVAEIGPISVAIDASHSSFQLYRSGVYNEPQCSSQQLDHGVLVVGYGTEEDKDYWFVKNSWGTSWGDYGYIRMSRNKRNQCGIATQASYPIVSG